MCIVRELIGRERRLCMFGKIFMYNNFWQLEWFLLFIKYISAFCSWLSTWSELLERNFGIFAKQQHRGSYLCYKSQQCHHRQLPSFVGAVFKKTDHSIIQYSKPHPPPLQCYWQQQGRACKSYLNGKHWLQCILLWNPQALGYSTDSKGKIKKHQEGKEKKNSKWRKTKEGEVQKVVVQNVLCVQSS